MTTKVSGMKIQAPINMKQVLDKNMPFQNQFIDSEEQNDEQNKNINQKQLGIISKSDHLINNKIGREQQQKRIKNLNNGMQRLSVSILKLKQNCKDFDMQEILFKKRNIEKQKQIKDFLNKMKAERIQRNNKKKIRTERQHKSLEQIINLEQQKKKNKPILLVQQHLKKIKQAKQARKLSIQKQSQKNKSISEMYQKIHQQQKNKPKYHVRKLQQDREAIEKKLQMERQILQKRKQNYKPLDYEQFQAHSKRHDELLEQLDSVKKAQKAEQYLKILEQNKKLQECFRGKNYDMVVEQEQERKLKKDEPLQKYKKMKNYQQYVRQNFIPKNLRQEENAQQNKNDQRKSSQSHRQIKRYRYLQGVSYGEITQSMPIAKTEAEQRRMGVQYLAYMRSLPKKKEDKTDSLNQSEDNLITQILLKKKKPNPLAQRSGRRSVQVKVSTKPTREQLNVLMNQLKKADSEIDMKQKVIRHSKGNVSTKQVGQNLIFNIQKKLNLLSKL